MNSIRTSRLRLIPGTLHLFDAELDGHEQLAAALEVDVLQDWPPSGSTYDAGVVEFFRSQLAADPALAGWSSYYALLDGRLVATGGFFGLPVGGVVEIGYSVCLPWRRAGLATELIGGLVRHALDRGVAEVIARTTSDNRGSVGALARNLFAPTVLDSDGFMIYRRRPPTRP